MYTQCPACRTTFKITPAQLATHSGKVRCGICSAIFHAKQRLLPVTAKAVAPAPTTSAEISAKKNERQPVGAGKLARRRRGKFKSFAASIDIDSDIPRAADLSRSIKPRSPWRTLMWGVGSFLLLILFAGQYLYFYHDELAAHARWRSWVVEFCHYTGCTVHPRRDIALIEQLQTTIAPHPKFENALRLRTTLVNRAAFPQAYPWLEVSLTNNAGTVLARRRFAPTQYRETPSAAELAPNLVATALLDVTNPDGSAVGYEIRLVTP